MKKTLLFLIIITFVSALILTAPILACAESPELLAAKESAIFQLESFLENEAYTEAKKELQREMEKIVDEAILKIQEAESVEEVNSIKNDALNALADVDVGGSDWKKMLAVGILLVVLLIVAVLGFVIKKKRDVGKPRSKDDDDDDELISTVEDVIFNKGNEGGSEDGREVRKEESQTTEISSDEPHS